MHPQLNSKKPQRIQIRRDTDNCFYGQTLTITAGRAQLLEDVSELTNARPGLSNEQIIASARNLALLQHATGVGGALGFSVLQSLQTNLGLGEAQAVDVGTNLLNSGYDANAVEQIAARGGNAGGLELLTIELSP